MVIKTDRLILTGAEEHQIMFKAKINRDPKIRKPNFVGCVLFYEMESNSIVRDRSKYRNDDSTFNDPPTVSEGQINKCLYFDGVDDDVIVDVESQIQLVGNNDFTVSFWCNYSTPSAGKGSSPFGLNSASLRGIGFDVNSAGDIIFKERTDAGISEISTGADQSGSWKFITGTNDGANMEYFLNSVSLGTDTSLATVAPTSIKIGGANIISGVAERYNGYVDELIIFNTVLTNNEIISLYNQGF